MTSARLLLAGALAAGGFLMSAPASAYCSPVTYYLVGICNPCDVTAIAWRAADDATGGGVLGPIYCPD